MKAQAVLFTEVNQITVDEVIVPDPEPDEVLVEVTYSCISPGTELRCLAGKQPDAQPFPFIPGYAAVGHVTRAGKSASIPEGTAVYCGGTSGASHNLMWGAHISHVVKSARAVIPIPEGVDLVEAAGAKIAAISYHGLRHSRPQPQEEVVVVGLGMIGQISARLHALTGAHVLALDLSARRVEQANQFGVTARVPSPSIEAAVREIFPDGADVIVDATGSPSVLAGLISLARDIPWDDSLTPGARLLIQGSYPAEFALLYQEVFRKELAIYVPRDSQPRDYRAVLSLLARGKLQLRDLIEVRCSPDQAPEVYGRLQSGEILTAVFQWK
jgi:2-desacetyl-2-hydroxyethyl bacteriochlorophyllide A dehydrogenase